MSSAVEIPESHTDLVEGKTFGQLACLMPNGRLANNTVVTLWDGSHLRFSTVKSRQKHRNLVHDPRVALFVADPTNPWRYLELRGSVELEDDADHSFINRVAQVYMGEDEYPFDRPGEERVTCTLRIEQVRAEDIHLEANRS